MLPFELVRIEATDDAGDNLVGHARVFGGDFHLAAVRVDPAAGQPPRPRGADCRSCWKAMQRFYDGPYQAVDELPGFPGHWAVFLHPFGL